MKNRGLVSVSLILLSAIILASCGANPLNSGPLAESSASQTGVPALISSPESQAVNPAQQDYRIFIPDMPTPSLALGIFEQTQEQPLLVFLPPGYYETEKLYPVVYYLHGYGGRETEIQAYVSTISSYFSENPGKEFILVGVNGNSQLGGSFYANSAATGNWEDYIVNDIVSYVDANFRTIADKDSRGIAGFSMGGYGAVNIALKHPDIYSCLFSIAPGLFAENGLQEAFDMWPNSIKQSYGAAFSPNLDNPDEYYNIPVFDGSEADNAIVEQWENGYGNLAGKVEAYTSLPTHLNAIHTEYGSNDRYAWIPVACQYFSSLLLDNGFPNDLVEFPAGHEFDRPDTIERFIAFFEANLESEVG